MKAQAPIPQVITGVYDFNDDVNNGAAGVLGLNAFIPPRSIVLAHATLGDVQVTGGGGATVGVGVIGDANAFLGQTAMAAFSNEAVLAGVDLWAVPLYFADAVEIAINKAVMALTGGRFFVNVYVWQMPSPVA